MQGMPFLRSSIDLMNVFSMSELSALTFDTIVLHQVAFRAHSGRPHGQQQRRSIRPVMAASQQAPEGKAPALIAAAAMAAAAALSPLNASAISGGGGKSRLHVKGLMLCICVLLFHWIRSVRMPPGTGSGIPLTYQDLTGKDFKGSKLYKADLRGTNFSKADMKGASLFGAFCKDAKFNGADLSNADLESVDFEGADLSEAILEGAQVGGDYAAILYHLHLQACTLMHPFCPWHQGRGLTLCKAWIADIVTGGERS